MKYEIIKDLEEKINLVLKVSKSVQYNSGEPKDKIVLGFSSRVIENIMAIGVLLKVNEIGFFSAIMPLLRNSLEAIIDMNNLINIDGYVEYLQYLDINQRLAILRNLDNESINAKRFNKNKLEQEYKDSLEYYEKILKEKYDKKFIKGNRICTKIFFKFQLNNNEKIYNIMYKELCSDTHNNLKSIIFNHIDSGDGTVSLCKNMSLDECRLVCETSISILNVVLEVFSDFFNVDIK